MKSRRFTIRFLFCSLVLLAACSANIAAPQPTSTNVLSVAVQPSSAPITVNWMGHWQGEDLRESLVHEIATEFEFKNPGVKVNLRFPEQIMGQRSKVLTAKYIAQMIRSKNYNWDIVWMDTDIYPLVAQELGDAQWGSKFLVNFENIPGFAASQKPFILSDPTYRNQTGGIIVGPYIEGYYYSIYYDVALAQKLGIQIKQEGMTFEDLLGYVRTVYEYNKKNNTAFAAFYEANDWTTTEAVFQNLAKSALNDFTTAKSSTKSAEKLDVLSKTLKSFEQLAAFDPVTKSYADNDWFKTRGTVFDDNTLFYVNGTWM